METTYTTVQLLTNGGDGIVGRRLEHVPRPGGADDLQSAGVGADQEHPRRDVALELEDSHGLQQSRVPETFLVGFEESL